jgi:GT2 family glycosyltransferase
MADEIAEVAVILVMYKQMQNLELLYGSLCKQSYRNFRIYFVDNNPDESEIEHSKVLNGKFTLDIEYIKSGSNAGFAAGNNLGAKRAIDDGLEFIFFLNNDNELESDCIESLVSALKSDPKSGAAGPMILFGEERKNDNIIQELGEECDFDKYRIIKSFGLKKLEDIESNLPAFSECDILSGGAVMFRQAALGKTGLWEERYFAYGDEIDIFRRFRDEGFSALAVSRARLYHHHKWNKDNKQNYYFEYYLIERNKFLYFHKFGLYRAMFLTLITDVLKFPRRLMWFIKVCDMNLGMYYLRGLFAGLFNRKGKPSLGFIH